MRCSGCDKSIRVSDSKRGRQIKCPACGQAIRVPDQDDGFGDDDLPAPRSSRRSGRKKKSKSSSLRLPIGAAVAFVVLVTTGLIIKQWMAVPAAVPSLPAPENQVATFAVANDPKPEVSTLSQPTETVSNQAEVAVPSSPTAEPEGSRSKTADALSASEQFFAQGTIPELRIKIADAEMEILKSSPRTFVIGDERPYVQATIYENGDQVYEKVALKLKGSAGSYRPVDDRPALTINVAKFEKEQTFHGLGKFHLNNSVQDDTYLHEWLCEELFRAAKVPATQVTHARVWLNDRDLGLYVLKSAFDKSFLLKHFPDAKGNLYEGGFVQDIDAELEKDSGKGPDDRSDLTALLQACREPDPSVRWTKVEQLLNVDQFISFMAMEMMVGHWDGYTLNHNNYRLYFDRKSNQAHFLPHGMDQVFGNAHASIIDFPSSIMGSTVMLNSPWRARYRERVGELLNLLSPTDNLLRRIDLVNDRLRPILYRMNPQSATDHDERVKRLKDRIVARVESLIQQRSKPDPTPREFDESGRLQLADWYPVSESPDAKLEVVEVRRGPKAYSIQYMGKNGVNASWRCKTLLAKGKYVLHAKMKSERINAADDNNHAVGAGIRVSGMSRSNVRKGTVNWTPVEFEFSVIEDLRNIEFVAELRGKRGQVWFEVESMYLTRNSAENSSATTPK